MEQIKTSLVSYCGYYCGACSVYLKGKCEGCKGERPKCAVGYKACKVRPCCLEKGISTCADCEEYKSVKDCKLFNPAMVRFGHFITRTSRSKGIEMIEEKGEDGFAGFMSEKNWVAVKLGK